MRLPFFKPYRAFAEFDSMPDEECERYARRVRINKPYVVVAPLVMTIVLTLAWPITWIVLAHTIDLALYVPVPSTLEMTVLVLTGSTVFVAALSGFALRDLFLWIGLRSEVGAARCPKCRQSLLGVPIQQIGVDPDPAKTFVRCPECGRKYVLMDIGLTPRDLVPFEQRGVDPNVGKRKRRPMDGFRPS